MGHHAQPFSPVSDDETSSISPLSSRFPRSPRPARPTYGHRLRTIAIAAAVGLSTGVGLGGATLADDDDGKVAMTAAPPAGMSVQVAEDDGLAQLTVFGIRETDIPGAAQDDDDDGTSRYVLVDIEVRNAGDAPFVFNSTRVRLVDALGTAYTRVTLNGDDDDVLGPGRQLRGQELDGDDRVRGWLAFAVGDGTALQGVSYRDDDGDDVGIADLTVAAIPQRDDDDWDDDGVADAGRGAGPVASSSEDDDDGGGSASAVPAPAPTPAPAPVTGVGYYGDDDDWDDDDWDDDDDD